MSVYCECCVLSGRGLWVGADHSSRGVLPTVVRRCVWSRNLVNKEALAHWGAVAPKTNKREDKRFCTEWLQVHRELTRDLGSYVCMSCNQSEPQIRLKWVQCCIDEYSTYNVNKNPTRSNSMQIFIYCNVTLHVSGVTAPSTVACRPRWREVAVPVLWPVPEAAVTVYSTPDDGVLWHPKYVEWLCSK